jgi:hypothetical protein
MTCCRVGSNDLQRTAPSTSPLPALAHCHTALPDKDPSTTPKPEQMWRQTGLLGTGCTTQRRSGSTGLHCRPLPWS